MLEQGSTQPQQSHKNEPLSRNPKHLDAIREQVIELIEKVTGQRQVIIAHTLIVDFFEGDHNAAILLNQVLYWSSRSQQQDGWFYKTYAQWQAELRFSPYQVWRVVRGDPRVQKFKRTLWSLGLETDVRMAPGGRNAMFYRLNASVFINAFTDWLMEHYAEMLTPKQDSPQISPTKAPRKNPLNAYISYFGKLTNPIRKAIWSAQHGLGEQQTLALIDACRNRYHTWEDVLQHLRDFVLQQHTPATTENSPQKVTTPQKAPQAPLSENLTQEHLNIWSDIHEKLAYQINRAEYHAHLAGMQLVDLSEQADNLMYVIAVETEAQRQAIEQKWLTLIKRQLIALTRFREIQLIIVTHQAWRDQQRR